MDWIFPIILMCIPIVVGLIHLIHSELFWNYIFKILKNKKSKEVNMTIKDLKKGNVFLTKKGNWFVVGEKLHVYSDPQCNVTERIATNLKTGSIWLLNYHFEDCDFVEVYTDYTKQELIWKRPTFSKKDLVNGAIVTFRNGDHYIVMDSALINLETGTFISLCCFDDNLVADFPTSDGDHPFDIVDVDNDFSSWNLPNIPYKRYLSKRG